MIAVGSNHREVTVFQPALAVGYDRETGNRHFQDRTGSAWPGCSFSNGASRFSPVWKLDFGSEALGEFGKCTANRLESMPFPIRDLVATQGVDIAAERKDCRLSLPLGPSGSNIPSIDFVSDENGEASVVLASDVNGMLVSQFFLTFDSLNFIYSMMGASVYIACMPSTEPSARWNLLCLSTYEASNLEAGKLL